MKIYKHIVLLSVVIFLTCSFLFALTLHSQSETPISGVVNSYSRVLEIDYCARKVTVSDPSLFKVGSTVLIIQMQGADIDSSSADSSQYGIVTDAKSAGNFEFATVGGIVGNVIETASVLLRNYHVGGKVQLITVPEYRTALPKGEVTCSAWNGSTGGVLTFIATGGIDLRDGTLSAAGKGFRGGALNVNNNSRNITSLFFNLSTGLGAGKGEGITEFFLGRDAGRGRQGNGGGGGNAHNSGGGGGGNGGDGGNGGREYVDLPKTMDNGGIGGVSLPAVEEQYVRAMMGGGGGGGHRNNNVGTPGVAGGGIIIVKTNVFVGRNKEIVASGLSQVQDAGNDGAGGGGAGGTVILEFDRLVSGCRIASLGGGGGNVRNINDHGTGGGGGGGIVFISNSNYRDSIQAAVSGGLNGMNITNNSTTRATPGKEGVVLYGYGIPFNKNLVLTARTAPDTIICKGSSINIGRSAIGGRPPYKYTWTPSSGLNNPSSPTPRATPQTSTRYTVVVTDSLGCTSTAAIGVNLFSAPDLTIQNRTVKVCEGSSATIEAIGSGSIIWSPSIEINRTDIAAPIVSPTASRTYFVELTDVNGCKAFDSIRVELLSQPQLDLPDEMSICSKDSLRIKALATAGTSPYNFFWTFNGAAIASGSSDSLQFLPATEGTLKAVLFDSNRCTASDSVKVYFHNSLTLSAGQDVRVCRGDSALLNVQSSETLRGVVWTPTTGLDNPTSTSPLAFPSTTTTYYVYAENAVGCSGLDSVTITVLDAPLQPVLAKNEDTLRVVNVQNGAYQWYVNGTPISGADSSMFVANSNGEYTVEAVASDGCKSLSLPINMIIGSATLCMDFPSAKPGVVFDVPVYFCSQTMVKESGAAELSFSVRWNASMLHPESGNYVESTREGNKRIVRLQAALPELLSNPITVLRFQALLGDDVATPVEFLDLKSKGGRILLSGTPSVFATDGICYEGGVRLWEYSPASQIVSIFPSPALSGEKVVVAYALSSADPVQWTLTNAIGVEIMNHAVQQPIAGYDELEFDLTSLSSGVYLLSLRTPTESASASLMIVQ